MFGIVDFPLFLLAVFILNVTPGPDIAYVAGQSIVHGRRAGVMSALGVSIGGCVHTLFCALGLTALLAASPSAFTLIKTAGGLYLVYLGLRTLFARKPAAGSVMPVPRLRETTLLLRGFVTNVTNPKVLLFYVAFFPQFVAAGSPDKTTAFLLLGLVFVASGLAVDATVALVAARASRAVSGRPRVRGWVDRVIGTAFVGLGVRLLLARR
ncbi:LysE family translocator [Pseudomonas typographi]|uniref:LysE family translocator n=1 Tax=Pseudomonas typographi TaxID=2715964 RepID=A0ABR7Z815_9PSED|nr:LysE family translocator [Pseudomonas typographi]MBD1601408.1 LysE family translocator [Pseudomonas typographi]